MFWSWGRVLLITNCYSSLNLGPPLLIRDKKGNPWNGTILSCSGWKIQKTSSRQGHAHCLLGLWRNGSCRWDADRVDNQLWLLRQDAGITQEVLQRSSASQKSSTNVIGRKCKYAHKSEDSGSHYKIWTVLHHPLYSTFSTLSFSYIRSPEGCDLRYEVWNMMMWFIQWGLGYASRIRHGIDKAYTHLFLIGTRP